MCRTVDQSGEHHQQSRHQAEHRKQADENRLDEHEAHVRAQLILHKGEGKQPGNGGKAAAGNFGDGLAQRGNSGLARLLIGLLLGEAVAEDDRIVDCQRQLQHQRDGVRDEGDFPHEEVCPHVQQRRCAEGQQQHRNLAVGAGGEKQHQNNDDKGDDVHKEHFAVDDRLQRVADLCVDVEIVHLQPLLDFIERSLACGVIVRPRKGHFKEPGESFIMLLAVVEFDLLHVLHAFDLLGDRKRLLEGDVAYNDLRRIIGDELLVHDIQSLPGFGVGRKEMLQAVVCDDERAGIYAHRAQYGKNDQDPSPLIDDRARRTRHQLVFVHISIPFPLREKRRIGLTQFYIIIRLCPVSKN